MSKRTRHTSATPQWQPISQLPLIAEVIDGQVAAVEELYRLLQESRTKPEGLDAATIDRVVQAHTKQRANLWVCEDQVRRWATESLTEAQRREVERLTGQMQKLRETVSALLALANELKASRIERGLETDEAELGLKATEGEPDSPRLGSSADRPLGQGSGGLSPKIGIDITREIEAHMATYPLPPNFQQLLALMPEADREKTIWLAKFAPCAVEVAVGLHQGRGFVLADRIGPLQAWFVRRKDVEKVITRAPGPCLDAIHNLLNRYQPRREGVIVLVTLNTIRPIHLTERGEMLTPGEFQRIPLRQQEPLTFPDVVTKRIETAAGVTFTFTHKAWGELGSVDVKSHGAQTLLQFNVARGDPADPLYPRRLELFQKITTELNAKFHAARGEPVPDQTPLDRMTTTMPLYSAFLAVSSSLELEQFVRELSTEQIQMLIQQAQTSLQFASPHDVEAIQQRLDELDSLLTDPAKFSMRDVAGRPYAKFSAN